MSLYKEKWIRFIKIRCSYAGDATEKKLNDKSNKNSDQKQRKKYSEDSVEQLLKYFLKKMSYADDGTRDNKTTSKY